MDWKEKIQEAETYQTMGLLHESLNIYQALAEPDMTTDPNLQSELKIRIAALQQQIKSRPAPSPPPLRSIENATGSAPDDNLTALKNKADAFRELGLFGEAADTYREIITIASARDVTLLPGMVFKLADCLLEVMAPEKAVAAIEAVLGDIQTDAVPKARILHALGL
jgi:tetratricopeptide (TPR) repeat protein